MKSFFDQFDDTAVDNASWTTSIFYRLWANDSHLKYALTNADWTKKQPAFDNFVNVVTELTGQGTGALGPDEALLPDDFILSGGNAYKLYYQANGDLVLFNSSMQWVWHTNTSDANQAVMQGDGNFVVYDSVPYAVWSSGTDGNDNGYLVVQDDGEVRIYNASGRPILTVYPSQ